MTGIYERHLTHIDGTLTGKKEQKLKIWKEYVEALLDDDYDNNHALNDLTTPKSQKMK